MLSLRQDFSSDIEKLALREAAAHRRRGEEQLHTGNLSEGIH